MNDAIDIHPHSGRPLPFAAATRRFFEHLFEADLSAICLVEQRLPRGIAGAASGHTIAFAPGWFHPHTVQGRAMLAHEIAHVLQQQAPAHRTNGGSGFLIDEDREIEANLWACVSVLRQALPRSTSPYAWGSTVTVRASSIAQPWIYMAKNTGDNPAHYGQPDYKPPLQFGKTFFNPPTENRGRPYAEKFEQLLDVADAWMKVQKAHLFLFNQQAPEAMHLLLKRWIGVIPANASMVLQDNSNPKQAMKDRGKHNVAGEMRYYHTYGELAWALHSEIDTTSLAKENTAAKTVLDHTRLAQVLSALGRKVFDGAQDPRVTPFLNTEAPYGPLHGSPTFGEVRSALGASASPKPRVLVGLLHDAKDLYLKAGLISEAEPSWDLVVKQEVPVHATKRENRFKALTISKYDSRYNVGTPDEADPWVLWMRDKGHPVWAGPSYTMNHMAEMARKVGATALEMEALFYGMFAYWNDVYPHTATPIHRFHETMAAAPRFDVPYLPNSDVTTNTAGFIGRIGLRARL